MGYTKLLLVMALVFSMASAESSSSDLEAKVELLSSKIAKLEEKNSELEMKVSEVHAGHDSSNDLAFDCFMTENWLTDGIMVFNDCDGTMLNTQLIIFSHKEHFFNANTISPDIRSAVLYKEN